MCKQEMACVSGNAEKNSESKHNSEKLMTSVFMNPNVLMDFIELYKNSPCLWQTNCHDYYNRVKRDSALDELLKYTRTLIPDATMAFIKKRIQIIRGCFRKELGKVMASKLSGASAKNAYTPKLWYFDSMMFTANQEIPPPSKSFSADTHEHQDDGGLEEDDDSATDHESNSGNEAVFESNERVQPKRVALRFASENNKRVKKEPDTQREKREKPTNTARSAAGAGDSEDDCEIVGKLVTSKLRKMEDLQKIFAEKLINDVLYKGLLGQLNESNYVGEGDYNSYRFTASAMSNESNG